MANNDETVSVRIFTKHLTCDQVSRLMGLQPNRCHEKGDCVSKNSSRIREESLWIYSPELDGDLEQKINVLADTLGKKVESLDALKAKGTVELYCSVSSKNGQGNMFLSKALIEKLSKISVDLSVEYYLC